MMASVLQDLRHAVRALLGTPVTSLVIVLTLALGIGMNTSIFSVVNAVLLRPFEYYEPDRLVHIGADYPSDGVYDSNHSGGIFRRIQASSDTLVEVAAVRNIQQNLSGVPTPVQAQVGWVSDNTFSMLGVSPVHGRLFAASDPPGLGRPEPPALADDFRGRAGCDRQGRRARRGPLHDHRSAAGRLPPARLELAAPNRYLEAPRQRLGQR